jgi:hypothetical protein
MTENTSTPESISESSILSEDITVKDLESAFVSRDIYDTIFHDIALDYLKQSNRSGQEELRQRVLNLIDKRPLFTLGLTLSYPELYLTQEQIAKLGNEPYQWLVEFHKKYFPVLGEYLDSMTDASLYNQTSWTILHIETLYRISRQRIFLDYKILDDTIVRLHLIDSFESILRLCERTLSRGRTCLQEVVSSGSLIEQDQLTSIAKALENIAVNSQSTSEILAVLRERANNIST